MMVHEDGMKICVCDQFLLQQSQVNDMLAICLYYERIISIQLGPQELMKYRGFASIEKDRIQREEAIGSPNDYLEKF